MEKHNFLFITVFLLLASGIQADSSSQLLEKINKNLADYSDYKTEIKETSRIKSAAGIQTTSSTIKITGKGELLFVDNAVLADGIERHIVQLFDGRRLWYYDVNNKQVQKVELVKIPKELRDSIRETMQKQSFDIPKTSYTLKESGYSSGTVYIFELKEEQVFDNQVYEKVLFVVDKETLLPVKQEMTIRLVFSPDGEEKTEITIETTREYSNWNTNTGIPDYKFVLALPDDVQVIDVSQDTKEKLTDLIMK